MEKFSFGRLSDGQPVTAYRLRNNTGAEAVILDYGCTVQSLKVPNKAGGVTDVVLGYDSAAEYETNGGFFGAAIGRVGNRIAGSSFELDGKTYPLSPSEGRNQLHGGICGFDRRMWAAGADGEKLVFSRVSPDGEEGYPGNLTVKITYELLDGNSLRITYDAVTDAPTLVNLTNHSYFNLNGGGDILGHKLQIFAKYYTEVNDELIPTGRLIPVAGTPMDFRTPKTVGQDIDAECRQLKLGGGYDHNFALDFNEPFHIAAILESPESGIVMTVRTTEPGMQFYSGNSITPRKGKGGALLSERSALCLETQLFPDAIHQDAFLHPVLRPGLRYLACTSYSFD